MPEMLIPVVAETAQVALEHGGPRVSMSAPAGQQQEARVVGNQVQAAVRRAPGQQIQLLQGPRSGRRLLASLSDWPDAVAFSNVAQPPAEDAANSEAAPLAHRRGLVPPLVGMRKANGQLPGEVGRRGKRARRKLRKTRFPSKPVMLATENQPLSQAEAWLRVRD